MNIIGSLLIGFFPIIVYIIAEEFFGLFWGLIIAILTGVVEFIITYVKDKKAEELILFDIGLLLVFGLVSIIFENDIFFKLKPAIFQLIVLVLLGISTFTENPLVLRMSKRYMKNLTVNEAQIAYFKKMLKPVFWIFVFHTMLIVYSAFFLPKSWWAFISGFLLYIILGLYLLLPLGKMFYKKLQYRKEEWFDIVTEEGKIIGKAPRSVCHSNPDLLHPVVHLHVFNADGELLLQKRAPAKDIQPDKWDTAVGGHINSGEGVESALLRESEEELGISGFAQIPLIRYVMKSEIESELVHAFKTRYDGDFDFCRDEITEIKFWKIEEIEGALDSGIFTPNFVMEFRMLKELKLI